MFEAWTRPGAPRLQDHPRTNNSVSVPTDNNRGDKRRWDVGEIEVVEKVSTINAMLRGYLKHVGLKLSCSSSTSAFIQVSFFPLISPLSCSIQQRSGNPEAFQELCDQSLMVSGHSRTFEIKCPECSSCIFELRARQHGSENILWHVPGGIRAACNTTRELFATWSHVQRGAGGSLMATCFAAPITQVPRKQSILSHTSKWLISPKWAQPNLD